MFRSNLPTGVGLGFKPEHFPAILTADDRPAFFEIHAENYMGAGGMPHAMLAALRRDHALSIHGVGLSIGGEQPLDQNHLDRLRVLCDRYEPESFSEHLAWSSHDQQFLNDLLPLPYTDRTLQIVCDHIDAVQARLKRQMLLENPATYLVFRDSTWEETAFLAEIVRRTGCGLLLDINNVFVACGNHGVEPEAYLSRFPLGAVGEIHLAGHAERSDGAGGTILVDSHDRPVIDPVWALYASTLSRMGPRATLIEWDNDVPDWSVLMGEAAQARAILTGCMQIAAE